MQNDTEPYTDPSNSAVALFLMENDGDDLTDILVAALSDALRILREEMPA